MSGRRAGPGLPVRRGRVVDRGAVRGVIVDVDPSADEASLAVVHAAFEAPPDGHRIVWGYDVVVTGLGAWIGDRGVQVQLWPALVDEHGAIDDERSPGTLRIDLDPTRDRALLDDLAERGRLLVAGADIGPVPIVVDLDPDLVAAALADATG